MTSPDTRSMVITDPSVEQIATNKPSWQPCLFSQSLGMDGAESCDKSWVGTRKWFPMYFGDTKWTRGCAQSVWLNTSCPKCSFWDSICPSFQFLKIKGEAYTADGILWRQCSSPVLRDRRYTLWSCDPNTTQESSPLEWWMECWDILRVEWDWMISGIQGEEKIGALLEKLHSWNNWQNSDHGKKQHINGFF